MQCPYCSEQIEQNFQFCPYCGSKIAAPPTERQDEYPVKKRSMPLWFKLVGLLAVLALIGVTGGILFTETLVDTVENQLEALQDHDIDKAYLTYTSKEFQNTTSIEQFRDFVQAFPIFLENQSAHFTQRSISHNVGTLKGILTSSDHINTPIEYKVIKEDGRWKILSIRLLKPKNIPNAREASHTEDLIEVVKEQLKDIQESKVEEAYHDYSSKEFMETTSEENFHKFIKRYPILTEHHIVSFHKPTVRNGVGALSVIIQSDQVAAYIKYYLIFEDKKWKVWSMRILSPAEPASSPRHQNMTLEAVSIGSHIDKNGQVADPQNTFSPPLGDLYVNIEVKDGVKGSSIHLSLQHIDSGTSIPAETVIEEGGDSTLMSIFTPPVNGWPKGSYRLIIKASSGITKSIDFTIE